jgi:addiction module RelE/StbE family toxin
MLNPTFTGPFKRDRKLMKKRGKDINELTEVMGMIIREQPRTFGTMLPRHENHPLHGKYKGKWGCHVEPVWKAGASPPV